MLGAIVMPAPAGNGASTPSMLALIVQRIAQAISRDAAESPPEMRALLQTMKDSCTYVGQQVLSASTQEDLDYRIDHVLESPLLSMGFNHLISELNRIGIGKFVREVMTVESSNASFIGDGQKTLANEADRLIDVMFSALKQIIHAAERAASALPVSLTIGVYDPDDPLAFLNTAAPPVASALLNSFRMNVIALALIDAKTHPDLHPWLAHALAERFVRSMKSYLALLTALPYVEIPAEDFPMSDRLDLDQIEKEHEESMSAIAAFVEAADASGTDVYELSQLRDSGLKR